MRWLTTSESKVFKSIVDGSLETDAESVQTICEQLEDRGLVYIRDLFEPCVYCGGHEVVAVGATPIGLLIWNALKEVRLA